MPTKDETIDIYDHRMIHMGTMSREKAHRLGHWHKTFQCWIIGRPRQIYSVLLQLRHKNKAVFPDKLDKSAAGHLTAGKRWRMDCVNWKKSWASKFISMI